VIREKLEGAAIENNPETAIVFFLDVLRMVVDVLLL
jgi:hypothetical protein